MKDYYTLPSSSAHMRHRFGPLWITTSVFGPRQFCLSDAVSSESQLSINPRQQAQLSQENKSFALVVLFLFKHS